MIELHHLSRTNPKKQEGVMIELHRLSRTNPKK
uniref:Uncharacterized protein n=1 Tax=Cucumis melo TaxID=3656 RepID=A0A9I9E3S4_CUCME